MSVATTSPRHDPVPNRLRAIKAHLPAPVKAGGRRMLRQIGVLSAGQRVMPDFLIIGAKRGGTTSLWNWLLSHPGVLPMFPGVQQIKSPHYFDIHHDRGQDWYLSHFPTHARVAAFERRHGYRPVTGESSPYYLFHPEAPRRVAAELPTTKLIVLLRDPVKRAYSNYWERRGSGAEDLPTFEDALAAEDGRLAGEAARISVDSSYYSLHHDCHSYLARGDYATQLRHWFDQVDRERFLILTSEEMYADPSGVVGQVHRFLGIPARPVDSPTHHNRLRVPPIDPATAARLHAHYEQPNRDLAELLGRTLPWAQ